MSNAQEFVPNPVFYVYGQFSSILQNPQFLANLPIYFPNERGAILLFGKSGTFEKHRSRKCEKEKTGTGREEFLHFHLLFVRDVLQQMIQFFISTEGTKL
jgi:hypothetical protein